MNGPTVVIPKWLVACPECGSYFWDETSSSLSKALRRHVKERHPIPTPGAAHTAALERERIASWLECQIASAVPLAHWNQTSCQVLAQSIRDGVHWGDS